MTRRIVFIGNCQMEVMRNLYDKFVGGITGDETHFLPSWTEVDDSGTKLLGTADLLVNQIQSFTRELDLPPDIAAVPRIPVPLVSASFLWPFGGAAHPANTDSPFLKGGPFPGELGDGFLNRLIREGVPADQALEHYRQHDLGGPAALNRRYELIIDQQRSRDEGCDFSIAPEIEKHFQIELLFLSPHHPGLRITRTLAAQCFDRMGAPRTCIDMLVRDLKRSPFPQVELPIHPTVARHFSLAYIDQETDFYWHGEGRFTWDQWVLRYMNNTWSPALFEGWTTASADPESARRLLSSALRDLPGSPLAHAGMAKALQAAHDLEAAWPHITEAVRLAPEDPEFARVAAFIASGLRRHHEAAQFAKAAASFDPGSIGGLQLLAKLQEDDGDFAGAEETRRTAVALHPHNSGLVTDLGTTLARLDRSREALACYQRGWELAPNDAGPYFGASIVLAKLERTEEAVNAVEIALRLRPGVAAYFSHYGHLLLRLGRRQDGIAAFSKALEFDPHNAGIHHVLADLMQKDQLSKDGLKHAKEATRSAPSEPHYQVKEAQLLTRHMRLIEAIEAYQRAIALLPHDLTLHSEVGVLYVRLDRLEEAASELKLALDPDAPTVKSVTDLSAVLMRMGRFAEARQIVEHAARLQPQEAQFAALQAEIGEVIAGRKFAKVGSIFIASEITEIIPSQEFTAPACLQYTNFPEMNPTFGTHHVDVIYVEKKRWVPAISLCRLPANAYMAVPNGEEFIPVVGTTVVAEQLRHDWADKNLGEVFATCTGREVINEPSVLIGRYGVRTWGHWLGELLPKIVAVESRWPGRFRFILPERFVTDPVHITALQSLAYYGIGRERLILAPPKTIYSCPNLYVVTSAWSEERVLHPEVAMLMREQGPRDRDPSPGWLKAALLRRSTRSRNIQNIAEVESLLVANGFTLVDIERLNFRQQVDVFKNASAIVCVLGSGLSGLIYAPRGVQVLTVAPGEWGDLFFYSMIQERDAIFADVRGHSVATNRDDVATSKFTVPTDAMLAGMTAIGVANATAVDDGTNTPRALGAISA